MDDMKKEKVTNSTGYKIRGRTECDFEDNSIFKGNVKHEMMKRKSKN
jgi:hypothetical protein